MKKIMFIFAFLLTMMQGAWATAYNYYIAEKNGSTLTFKGSNTAPNGTNQWLISQSPTESWNVDEIRYEYTKVEFEPSFAEARPTSTSMWFSGMNNLESIKGIIYLNTSEVEYMSGMFLNCMKLKELNLAYFDTHQVTSMLWMFFGCSLLERIYVGEGWNTDNVDRENDGLMLFVGCNSLVGETGATVDQGSAETVSVKYAYVGEGGYLTSEEVYWDTHVSEGFREDGDNTYIIQNRGEMLFLAQEVNAGTTYQGKTFLLTKDLTYRPTSIYTTIGITDKYYFSGTFDGQGHTISGISLEGDGRQALFGTIVEATIRNLTLENSTIINTNNSIAAGIVGRVKDGGSIDGTIIENCHVKSDVTIKGDGYAGGIVGTLNTGFVTISDCTSAATIAAGEGYSSGGIAGFLGFEGTQGSADVTIMNCLYYGESVTGTEKHTGAIAGSFVEGRSSSFTFSNNFYCYPDASIQAFGRKGVRSGTMSYTYNFDIADNHGAVRTRLVEDEQDIEDMGMMNEPVFTDGVVVYERGVKYDGKNYSHVLALDRNADNSQLLDAFNGMTFDVLLRNNIIWHDGWWHALCLPFTLGKLQNTPLEGADIRTIDTSSFDSDARLLTIDFGTTNLKSVASSLPYVVRWTTSEPYGLNEPVFNDVTIDNGAAVGIETPAVTFQGTLSPFQYTAGDKSLLFMYTNNTLYYPTEDETPFAGFSAYFQLADGLLAGRNVIDYVINIGDDTINGSFEEDNMATGIGLASSSKDEGNGNWYDLQGRRLSGKPTKSGVYINNGVKVVMK